MEQIYLKRKHVPHSHKQKYSNNWEINLKYNTRRQNSSVNF